MPAELKRENEETITQLWTLKKASACVPERSGEPANPERYSAASSNSTGLLNWPFGVSKQSFKTFSHPNKTVDDPSEHLPGLEALTIWDNEGHIFKLDNIDLFFNAAESVKKRFVWPGLFS